VILAAVDAATGEVVGTLENLESHSRDLIAGDVVVRADGQRRVDDGLPVDQ